MPGRNVLTVKVTASASEPGRATLRLEYISTANGGARVIRTVGLAKGQVTRLANVIGGNAQRRGYCRPYFAGGLGWVWHPWPDPRKKVTASEWEAAAIQREGRS